MDDKNLNIENQEELQNEDLIDEGFVELEIQKEIDRMTKEIIYDDESLAQMINGQKFQDGCNDASYFCGFYTGLINAGLSNIQAYEMTINAQTCEHNKKLQEIINKNQLEVAKVQQVQIQQQQL